MASLLRSVLSYIPGWRTPEVPPRSNLEVLCDRFHRFPEVNNVVNKYFSAYVENLLPLDEQVFEKVEEVLHRKSLGKRIAHEWGRILLGSGASLKDTHLMIPNEPLLLTALKAQFTFDRELMRLKTLDRYQCLYHGKVLPELNVLKKAQAKQKLTEQEQQLIHQLNERGLGFGRTLSDQIGYSIQLREGLLVELRKRIDALIQAGPTAREQSFINPSSEDLHKLFTDLTEQEHPEELHCRGVHPAINDYYVFSFRDPILREDAKFIIAKKPVDISPEDWRDFISSEGRASLLQIFEKENLFQTKGPNEPFYVSSPQLGCSIEVCYENASETLALHENRDVGMKTRRKVLKDGRYARENEPIKCGLVSATKNLSRTKISSDWSNHREATAGADCHEAISVSRALISHILNGNIDQLSQKAIQNLGEYFDSLTNSDVAFLPGSYTVDPRFTQANKMRRLIQANLEKIFKENTIIPCLEQGLDRSYSWEKDRARVGLLTQDLFESYRGWSRNLKTFLAEVQKPKWRAMAEEIGEETLNLIGPFIQSLDEFLEAAPHPEIQKILDQRKPIIKQNEDRQKVLIQKRGIVARSFKNDPARLAAALAEIEEEQKAQNREKAKQLDQIWIDWRKTKTPEQVDQILEYSFNRVEAGLERFTPSLVLINVPFSSKQKLDQVENTIRGPIERLLEERENASEARQEIIDIEVNSLTGFLNLYRNAIPPIWQNKVKIQTLVGELMKGTELSPLWLKEADTMRTADRELIKNEFIRSRLSKLNRQK